jgi:hypothetical protein
MSLQSGLFLFAFTLRKKFFYPKTCSLLWSNFFSDGKPVVVVVAASLLFCGHVQFCFSGRPDFDLGNCLALKNLLFSVTTSPTAAPSSTHALWLC